jgi:tetratricopeptide (TPR) repeat protein
MLSSRLQTRIASAFGLASLFFGSSCLGSLAFDETGSTGSITITKHATDAAKAFAGGDWAKARDEYRTAISMSPDTIEFYFGLYDVCTHSKEWDQVTFALEKIFELDPAKKKVLGAEYGEALCNLGRYDEAIPVLKQALVDANIPIPKVIFTPPAPPPEKKEAPKPTTPPATTAGAATQPATTTGTTPVATVTNSDDILRPGGAFAKLKQEDKKAVTVENGELAKYAKTFETAVHSECILIATYEGYTHSSDISYFHPPIAKYRIQKFLKGPPLNRDLPLRYEFHDRSEGVAAPKDWKFSEDKMPKRGSEWLIFIKNGLPRDGAFDTYMGNYGRQEATVDNLNHVYALLENSANR